MNNIFTRWWVTMCVLGLGAIYAYYTGLFEALWALDRSRISSVTLVIFVGLALYIGRLTYKLSKETWLHSKDVKRVLPVCWFFAENLMSLGMLGTIIGFMMMLGPALATLDTTNTAATKATIISMGVSMSTALITTLVGLSTAMVSKGLLINLELELEDDPDNAQV